MTTSSLEPVSPVLPVHLHDLTYLDEGGDVVIGRPDTDSYAVFPPDGAALVRRLAEGVPPDAAARWYEETYGQEVDIADLLATLEELGLVAHRHGPPAGPSSAVGGRRAGAVLFSPPALLAYALLVGTAAVLMVRHPALAPLRSHIFFTHWLIVVDLVLMVGQIPLALFHEGAHVLAGRRLGVRSRIRVSRRFMFVVFETVLDGLVAVPRRRRYLPLAAGMLADLVSMATLTIVAFALAGPQGEPLAGRFCLALAFTGVPRIALQFCVFLRTDVYYLLVTALGCTDLQSATRQRLVELVDRLPLPGLRIRLDREASGGDCTPRDRQVARWFGAAVVAGYAAMTAVVAEVVVPIVWQFATRAVHEISGSHAAPTGSADAAAVLGVTVAQVGAALLIDRRERRAAHRARLPRPHLSLEPEE